MEALLNENKIKALFHKKWFKNLEAGNIIIKNTVYNLKTNENKRTLVYNAGVATSTKPFNLSISNTEEKITPYQNLEN
jgi:hypothetical protein